MLKAKIYRNCWSLLHIIETLADKQGVAWTGKLKIGSEKNVQQELVRQKAKIVLLVEDNSTN